MWHFWFDSQCALQNPISVKAREEVVRLTKKIKTAETELVLKRGLGERQALTIAKLQEDLDKINAGVSFCRRISMESMGVGLPAGPI